MFPAKPDRRRRRWPSCSRPIFLCAAIPVPAASHTVITGFLIRFSPRSGFESRRLRNVPEAGPRTEPRMGSVQFEFHQVPDHLAKLISHRIVDTKQLISIFGISDLKRIEN